MGAEIVVEEPYNPEFAIIFLFGDCRHKHVRRNASLDQC
jgi:hypothetical protein